MIKVTLNRMRYSQSHENHVGGAPILSEPLFIHNATYAFFLLLYVGVSHDHFLNMPRISNEFGTGSHYFTLLEIFGKRVFRLRVRLGEIQSEDVQYSVSVLASHLPWS